MKSVEAKGYFCTLGQLYKEARVQSRQEATQLITGKKQTPEYFSALMALKFGNNHHFTKGVNSESTVLQRVVGTSIKATTDKILQSASVPELKRWLAMYKTDEGLVAFISCIGVVKKQMEGSASTGHESASDIFRFGGRLQIRNLMDRWENLLGRRYLNEDSQKMLKLRRFADCGSLAIAVEGISFSGFVEEDFRNKRKTDYKRIKEYLIFFMEMGGKAGDIELEERIQEQNAVPEAREYPFMHRNLIREAHHIARAFYVFPVISPHKFARSCAGFPEPLRKNIEAIAEFAVDCQQRFAQFTNRVNELVFNPQLEGSKEIRGLCLGYINSNDRYTGNFLFSVLGITVADPMVAAYRRSIDLIKAGHDTDFYKAVASWIEDAVERSTGMGITTIEDIEDITTPVEAVGKAEESFTALTSTVQRLNTIPKWQDIDITEIDVPWEGVGVKRPKTVKLDFPNGNPFTCKMELGYQGKAGDTMSIELKVDLKRKQFGWSVLQAPERYPDLQFRFLEALRAIFSEIYKKLGPAEQVQKVAEEMVTPAPVITPKVKRPGPIRFVGPAETKRTKPKGVETPPKIALPEQPEKHHVKDHILIPGNETLNALLTGIPNSQRGPIIRKMANFNKLGRGRLKKLTAPGPNGERQDSLRAGDYRIVLLEQSFSKGIREYGIREIGNRRIIYDVVDD